MNSVTESIFSGATCIIPMAEVQYIETDRRDKYRDAIHVILRGTTWNQEIDSWNNAPYLRHDEAERFMQCWCTYRAELEKETLMDLAAQEQRDE